MNYLNPNVVAQVHYDRSHQIRGGHTPLFRANHCCAENIFTNDGYALGHQTYFAEFIACQIELKGLVDRPDRKQDETKAAAVEALKEHQGFEPWLFEKYEVAMIFETRQPRRKPQDSLVLIVKLAKEPGLNLRHSGLFG